VAYVKVASSLDFGLLHFYLSPLARGVRAATPWRSVVPKIPSARKNMRKSRAAAVRNRAQRSALRTALKKAKATDATPEQRRSAVSLLDRAARKGLIHRNAAARHKSTLSRQS
jgi:small subunit ribosomal protein S20